MHFEVLTEDASGCITVNIILGKILGVNGSAHTWRLHPYRGIGRIPQNLSHVTDPANRLLLDRLPKILRGYGRSLDSSLAAVIVVVDLDNKDCMKFKSEMLRVLDRCSPRPETLFRIAIEESEAWLLGDRSAIKAAYPRAKDTVLDRYVQDSICGTWEVLADATRPGGAALLKKSGWPYTGKFKSEAARTIAPHLDVGANRSKSFQVFRDGVRRLAGIE